MRLSNASTISTLSSISRRSSIDSVFHVDIEDSNNSGSISSNSTRVTRQRSSSLSTSSSASTVDTEADAKLDAFVNFLGRLNNFHHNSGNVYAYQIFVKSKPLYDGIGTLAGLLGVETDEETFSVLGGMGLCKKSRFGYAVNRKSWEKIDAAINGSFSFIHQYGKNKQNLFALGGKKLELRQQIEKRTAPPLIPDEILGTARRFFRTDDGDNRSNSSSNTSNDKSGENNNNNNNSSSDGVCSKRRRIEFVHGDDYSCRRSKKQTKPKQFNKSVCPICDGGHPLIDCDRAKAHGLVISYDETKDTFKDQPMTTEESSQSKGYSKGYRSSFHKGRTVMNLQNRLRVVDVNVVNTAEKNKKIVDSIRKIASKKRLVLSQRNALYLGTFAARFPQLPDVGTEQAIAAGGLHCASVFGLCDPVRTTDLVSFDSIVTMAPSRTTIKQHVSSVAAHKIIRNGRLMQKAERVYIAADHGGGVLVKMAFYWDSSEKKVQMMNLDFDRAGHDAKAGGRAIRNSIRKYISDDNTKITFAGGSSDSGGGFTKDAMKKALVDEGLADPNEYIHVSCTEHNDQTALRVAANKAYGTGHVDNRNVLQLLHSFADFQKAHESTAQFKDKMKSEFLHIRGEEPPSSFLRSMQEPILTRWKTVGEASQFIQQYLDVLLSLCKSTCKMRETTAHSQLGKTAANFLSLGKEAEIVTDLAFFSDFDNEFFQEHFEFSRFEDQHIGMSGFISHHHLVRYYIKCKELQSIHNELENGSTDASLVNPKLKNFWRVLLREKTESSLTRARLFLDEYIVVLDKHSAQFVSSELLFLACFGEFDTSRIVARMLCNKDFGCRELDNAMFKSPVHKKTIDLEDFRQFVFEKCGGVIEAAKATTNFKMMEHSIRRIAHGEDIWSEDDDAMEQHRLLFLDNFGALPSTSVWVERAVKKAKLCQRTGNGERNVTAYCIAGDDLYAKCPEEIVISNYSNEMNRKRIQVRDKRGPEARSVKAYADDVERGPAMTKNILNHTLKLERDIQQIQEEIGKSAYKTFYEKTLSMLTQLPLQGSFARYQEQLQSLELARSKEHVPSARERLTGVDETAWARGEIPYGDLLMSQNLQQMKLECIARGLSVEADGKPLTWTKLKDAIKEQDKNKWMAANPGKVPPPSLRKHFKQQSCPATVEFIRKQR